MSTFRLCIQHWTAHGLGRVKGVFCEHRHNKVTYESSGWIKESTCQVDSNGFSE